MVTLNEMIERIDASRLNAYSLSEKIRWVETVNLMAHMQGLKLPIETYEPLTEDNMDKELLISAPYESLYEYYVYAQMDLNNNEISNFNNDISLYNAMWLDYSRYMIRKGFVSTQPTFKNIEP